MSNSSSDRSGESNHNRNDRNGSRGVGGGSGRGSGGPNRSGHSGTSGKSGGSRGGYRGDRDSGGKPERKKDGRPAWKRDGDSRGGDRRGGRPDWKKDGKPSWKRDDDSRGGFRGDDRRTDDRRGADRRGADRRGDDRRGGKPDWKKDGKPAWKRDGDSRGGRPEWKNDRRTDRAGHRRPGDHDRHDNKVRRNEPAIPEGITGRELAGDVKSQLRSLEKKNAETVAKHIVAAGRLVDTDPELAYEHAQAAVSRAARVGAVREAFGLVAYQLEKYDEAIRELRTHRRISGSNDNLAIIADSERGRGNPRKALELFESVDKADVDPAIWAELVIVAAGAHADLGDIAKAHRIIEAEGFTGHPSGATVRLLSAFSDVLRLEGDGEMADKYEELARRTARATGILFGDEEVDPNEGVEILTIEEEVLEEELSEEPPSETAEPAEPVEAPTTGDSPEPEGSVEPAPSEAEAPEGSSGTSAADTPEEDANAPVSIEDEVDEILLEAGIDPEDTK